MKKPHFADLRHSLQHSPWIVLGATAILLLVVLVLAIDNTKREKRYISEGLSIKGGALIRAVEAGARTGMMGWQWGGRQVQYLLEETARLPDVLYMALIDENGNIVAHSDSSQIGNNFRKKTQFNHINFDQKENWELVDLEDGRKVFEVHRPFRPRVLGTGCFKKHRGRLRHHREFEPPDRDDDWLIAEKKNQLFIVAGMNVAPFQKAISAEIRTTISISIVLLLLGVIGMVSLFWMHHYQTTKKSLRDASAFADEVVSHLPVGLIATDSKGNVAFFNAVAEKITGKRGTEVKGQPVDMIIPSKLFDFKNKIDSGKRISEEEIGCRFEDGSKVPLSVSATRITNEVDEFVGHVLILRDMREVRRLQEEVRRQEKLAAVGGLAAGVAHEIRNPLSSIKGMATYFAGLFEEDSHPRKAAEVMIQEVDRLNRTITELLEFARPTNLNRTETDIEPLLHRGLQLIQQDAEAHGVATKLTVSKNLCPVSIDSDRILQCLLNLFLNAIESMEDGGQLNIEADEDTMEKIRICISDTGNCISPENLNNIFNPYFTTKPNGTGLGLAIVHKIITAHNAHLKVVSTPEKGTSFIIWIPCKNSV